MRTIYQQKKEFFSRWNIKYHEISEQLQLSELQKRLYDFLITRNELFLDNPPILPNNSNSLSSRLKINSHKLSLYFPFTKNPSDKEFAEFFHSFIYYIKNIQELFFNLKFLFNEILIYDIYEIDLWGNYLVYEKDFKFFSQYTYKNQEMFQEIINISIINLNVVFYKAAKTHDFIDEYLIDFFPCGDKILDKELVNEIVPLLSENSLAQYQSALKLYLEKDYEKACDSLRKCLESFLKSRLDINQTLINTLKNLQSSIEKALTKKIKLIYGNDRKATSQITYISKFINSTCNYLKPFISDYEIPHNDGGLKHAQIKAPDLKDAEVEFMLYQTGAIIRLIDRMLKIDFPNSTLNKSL